MADSTTTVIVGKVTGTEYTLMVDRRTNICRRVTQEDIYEFESIVRKYKNLLAILKGITLDE